MSESRPKVTFSSQSPPTLVSLEMFTETSIASEDEEISIASQNEESTRVVWMGKAAVLVWMRKVALLV